MAKINNYILIVSLVLFLIALYNTLPDFTCSGIKCLKFSPEGRIVLVFGIILLSIINKYIGVLAVLLIMLSFASVSGSNDVVTDEYNCKVTDNIVSMDSVLKNRSGDKKTRDKKNPVFFFNGNFNSTCLNSLDVSREKIPPLEFSQLPNARFV